MLIWVLLVLLIAIVLMLGIEWLMRRFGVYPVDPQSRPGGIRDLLDRLPGQRD
jgi:hypothetical protein